VSATILQFPIKQAVQTQQWDAVNLEMWYVYYIDYQPPNSTLKDQVYIWARDDDEARARIRALFFTGVLGGRLIDKVVPPITPAPE